MSLATEQQIKIAARMYECRNTSRNLLGGEYQGKMRPLVALIRKVADQHNESEIQAGARIIRECGFSGHEIMFLLSAVVECVEPSEPTK